MTFLNSLLNNSKEHSDPFQHWELNEPLSSEAIKEINTADIANVAEHNLSYDGTRAIAVSYTHLTLPTSDLV